ncbi:hypothetical protein ACFXGA_18765 [Actinosynnema sp. NPDC059335]|uniref:hypothetical protein n=1 Tax=Actinosynnema sp. NPDC059335 TaxID=3346804 RepID=UPI00366D1C29
MSTPNRPAAPPTPRTALHCDLAQVLDHLVATRPNATIAELRRELGETLRHLIDATLNDADRAGYEERALLLAALSTHPDLSSAVLTVDTDPSADPRRTTVLVLDADSGQMTWHLDDRDVGELDHLATSAPHEPEALWDGTDKATTLARVRAFVHQQVARAKADPWS